MSLATLQSMALKANRARILKLLEELEELVPTENQGNPQNAK
jgi:hypothetical protein